MTKPFHATQTALNEMIVIGSSVVIVINLLFTQLILHGLINLEVGKL